MIGYLRGEVVAVRDSFYILSVQGVGYKVFTTRETLSSLSPTSTTSVWTHLSVRETALDLYGFVSEEELHFFEKLLTVSGIGPKSALGILDIAPVSTLRSAIATGKASYLTSVSGIGKKTAEKIVLELKDKIGASADDTLHGDEDTLDAMRALGYSLAEAREALRKVPSSISNSNDRIREALRLLGSR